MRANVKPFVHWAIYKNLTVRFHTRSPRQVTGLLKGLQEDMRFEYDPDTMRIALYAETPSPGNTGKDAADDSAHPLETLYINEHGWEIDAPVASESDTP